MKTRKAFTLVEIMIIVVVIALAAAMVIPAIQKINRPSTGSAAASQPIVGRFISTPDQRVNSYLVSILTDTKTKREYLVMYYNGSLCVRPLLGAGDLAEQVERNGDR